MTSVIIIDTETTGLENPGVVEIAMMRWDLPEGPYCYGSLVAPGRRILPGASATHGLVDEDVRNEWKLPEAILRSLIVVLGKAAMKEPVVFVAHNAAFDKPLVDGLISRWVPQRKWICTYRTALRLLPDEESHKNQVLRYSIRGLAARVDAMHGALNLDATAHRAQSDCIVTGELLRHLCTLEPLEEIIAFSDQPVIQKKVRFGKHAGQLWSEVPRDYLHWVLGKDFDEDTKATARFHLEKQKQAASVRTRTGPTISPEVAQAYLSQENPVTKKVLSMSKLKRSTTSDL